MAENSNVSAAPLALELHDVSKRFGSRWALARVSYSLPQGEALLLTGHNGSGKSTLLRLIASAHSPTRGHIKVLGADTVADRDVVRGKVALLSHASYLYEDLTAEQNLIILARLLGIKAPKEATAELLERLGLKDRSHHPVRQFSAGMRKRMAIARVLLKKPELALLDEPFGELDPSGIRLMENIIGSLQSSGVTLILATHLIDQGMALTQHRLHLSEGREVRS